LTVSSTVRVVVAAGGCGVVCRGRVFWGVFGFVFDRRVAPRVVRGTPRPLALTGLAIPDLLVVLPTVLGQNSRQERRTGSMGYPPHGPTRNATITGGRS
jgi:hypothetical protein